MNNQSFLTPVIFILLVASMSSCSHSFYAPNENIMVQLKDKNEIFISGNIDAVAEKLSGETNEERINSFQAGYSPIKGIAVAASYFDLKYKFSDDGPSSAKGNLWNGALGTYYFFKFGDKQNKDKATSLWEPTGILFDLYAGYGEGKIAHVYDNGGKAYFDMQNYFIQGGFHIKSPFIDVGLCLRKSLLNYYNGQTIHELTPYDSQIINEFMTENPYRPWQVTFRLAGGIKYGKVFFNYNEILFGEATLQLDGPTATIGVQFSVHEIIKGIN